MGKLANWQYYFIAQWKHTTVWEWCAVLLGIVSVLFSLKNKVWLYPTGIISTAIYTYLMQRSEYKLYAESLLNAYYTAMSLYGWKHWLWGDQNKRGQLPISLMNNKEWYIAIALGMGAWCVFYYMLHHFTDSDVAKYDAFVSATACIGMWLLARRKVENWLWFNISNIVAVPLLFYKRLPLTACLTIFLFAIAILGYRRWKKLYAQQAKNAIASV